MTKADMPEDCRPIGFFDSGVGGISVLKTVHALLPHENYIYYGDNANAPYGDKSEEAIRELSFAAGSFLYGKGVKAIVMACNTATSAAVIGMRRQFSIPVISMEPAVKPALAAGREGLVLVLATPATVSQGRYKGLLERLHAGSRVINIGCGGLVELIEQGRTDRRTVREYLEKQLAGLRGQRIGAVVIGCTHYSFIGRQIKDYIDDAFGADCALFDGRHGTAAHLRDVLRERDMLCGGAGAGNHCILYIGTSPPHRNVSAAVRPIQAVKILDLHIDLHIEKRNILC